MIRRFARSPRRLTGAATAPLAVLALLVGASACSFKPTRATTGSGGSGVGTGTGGSSGGSGGPAIPGLMSLRIEPAMAEVMVRLGTPATQQFKAVGVMADGSEQDVTAKVGWTADRQMLVPMISAGLATTTDRVGGLVSVKAASGAISGNAKLMIKFAAINVADGAGANPPLPTSPQDHFGGAVDDTRAPQLVYPNDGVLLPPNVNGIEVHYRPGSTSNTLFEIAFTNDSTDVRLYTRCVTLEDGCVYRPTIDVWQQIAETNRGLQPVAITVRGTDDSGTAVGKSATVGMSFSRDNVAGGLYYWTTSQVDTTPNSPASAIMRWDFGNTAQTTAEPFIVPRQAGDNRTCVGCHALSRDGTKLVATLGGQNDGRIILWDVAMRQQMVYIPTRPRSQFESWNPEGTQFVGMYTDSDANGRSLKTGPSNLILFNGTNAMVEGEIDLGGLRADHPDWSADGSKIVFTSVDTAGSYTDQKPQKSGISYVERTASGWSAPVTLLPRAAGKNRYYPAFAPNNRFIVFNESSCASGDTGADCDADTDPRATLYALPVPAAPDAVPTPLTRANAPGVNDNGNTTLTNTYPKWSPFVFQLNEEHQVLWATFSSKRRYGLYKSSTNLYIWMVAVDPGSITTDPSYSAFCLPFQDLNTSNHIAQWTQFVPVVK